VVMIRLGDAPMTSARQWYAIHTYSAFENKVKQTIERKIQMEGLSDKVERVVIPLEPVIEIKSGKKHTVMRNLMPGYLLIEMEGTEELFNLIREIKGVSGFVGGGDKPAPLTQAEVDNILNLIEHKADKPKAEITYRQGDQVKVTEGPFANFVGSVDHVDAEKNKLSVMVSIFGRPTPVELDVLQVEPAS
jgi:transcription termination/antitermination protein NusG